MKTKSEEISIIDKTISKLGPDSYLGPWLKVIRAELESAMKSDFYPQISLKDTEKQCERMKDAAKLEAAAIVKSAEKQADTLKAEALRERFKARSIINEAQKELEKAAFRL